MGCNSGYDPDFRGSQPRALPLGEKHQGGQGGIRTPVGFPARLQRAAVVRLATYPGFTYQGTGADGRIRTTVEGLQNPRATTAPACAGSSRNSPGTDASRESPPLAMLRVVGELGFEPRKNGL